MKTILLHLALALSLLAAPVVITGCAGGPERTALRAVQIETATVENAMKAFVDYEKIHGMDAATRNQVKAFYAQVVRHNLEVERGWLAYRDAIETAAPDAPALEKHLAAARALLAASQADLIALIQRLVTR